MVLVHKEPKIINDVAKFPISLCHGCKASHKQLSWGQFLLLPVLHRRV